MEDYRTDLQIDPNNLDVEWLVQPQLAAEYGELLAKARYEYDEAKRSLELVRAQLDLDIRKNPSVYDITGRLTETVVQDCIVLQPEYKRALDRVHKAKYNVDVLKAAAQAFEQRKAALENLVKLFGMQYYSTPTETHNLDTISQRYMDRLKHSKVMEKIYKHINTEPKED